GAGSIEVIVPHENDLPRVDFVDAERSGPDGAGVERLPRKLRVGDVPEEVRGKERNGRAVRERPVHIRQRETDRARRDAVDGDATEGVAVRAYVPAVLEQLDGEHDVIGGDRLAVVPGGVLTDFEGPDPPVALGVER